MSAGPYCAVSQCQINSAVVAYSCRCHITGLNNAAHEFTAGNSQVNFTTIGNSQVAFYGTGLVIALFIEVILIDVDYGTVTDNATSDYAVAQSNLSTVGCLNSILGCRLIGFIVLVDIGNAQACYLAAVSSNSILLCGQV